MSRNSLHALAWYALIFGSVLFVVALCIYARGWRSLRGKNGTKREAGTGRSGREAFARPRDSKWYGRLSRWTALSERPAGRDRQGPEQTDFGNLQAEEVTGRGSGTKEDWRQAFTEAAESRRTEGVRSEDLNQSRRSEEGESDRDSTGHSSRGVQPGIVDEDWPGGFQ